MNIDEESPSPAGSTGMTSNIYLSRRGARNELLPIDYIITIKKSKKENKENKARRQNFEDNLRAVGLTLEFDETADGKRRIIKLHCCEEALLKYAELQQLKLPLKRNTNTSSDSGEDKDQWKYWYEKLFSYKCDYYSGEKLVRKAIFTLDRKHLFLWKDEYFFTKAQRSRIVHEILSRTVWDDEKVKRMGIKWLIDKGCYDDVFPLHDGPPRTKIEDSGPSDDRNLLIAICGNLFKLLPLDLLCKYYGEKVAFYFSWIEFYILMLIAPSIFGIGVFVFGMVSQINDIPTRDICDKEGVGNFTLCPDCDAACTYKKLYDSCLYAFLSLTVENYFMIPYGFAMSVWASLTIKFWKRRQARHQFEWDVMQHHEIDMIRPHYEMACKHTRKNPVTGLEELYIPRRFQLPRIVFSTMTAGFMILLVLAFLMSMVIYRVSMIAYLSRYYSNNELFRKYIKIWTTLSSAFIQLMFMIGLNFCYRELSIFLTEVERPRTQTDYDYLLTFKVYCFRVVNCYGPLFYTAFFKHSFVGSPSHYNYWMIYRQEECDATGCLFELGLQFVIIFVGMEFFQTLTKIIHQCYRRHGELKEYMKPEIFPDKQQWELDIILNPVSDLRLFNDYVTSVIQFGYLSLFSSAMPLMPLLALINNVIEKRVNALDWLLFMRRPNPERAINIGLCESILEFLVVFGALINGCVIAFSSTSIHRYYFLIFHGSLNNFVEFQLSVFNTSDFEKRSLPGYIPPIFGKKVDICRYPDLRNPPWHPQHKYEYRPEFWHLLVAKLCFVIVYEHLVLLLTYFISMVIHNKPEELRHEEERKNLETKELMFKAELELRVVASTSSAVNVPVTTAPKKTQQQLQQDKQRHLGVEQTKRKG